MLTEAVLASASPSAPGVDWIALIASIVSIGISVLALVQTNREATARRVSNVPPELRVVVNELLNTLSRGEQHADHLLALSTPGSHVRVERLDEWAEQLADGRLARLSEQFAAAVGRCRLPDGASTPVSLNHQQLEKLHAAVEAGRRVIMRLNQLTKKEQR
ncbi:plasmid-related protein [Clavibacter sepedonicus]|uniref:Plasmid-related protein n=1 Tax=Clavibacter sepedonicus TaxID=31964 RepID=B0REZ3_CLASE|nr:MULTISPECIES: hypothetical protein [Clavibacter]MBD5382991.1 plasmid-related protein [Clavibacter sp.]OQJ49287.1 plasmid-related protein [Clavibacter sepedonicus]OQJ54902.1 plasmid-related protein [Clavibacter sepedonicus]UUK64868.1 plasmid-related protein [Clavibacter sepedonicus]CAQ00926.1 putative plasmid-related protein [Clavibacter sepedonicus]